MYYKLKLCLIILLTFSTNLNKINCGKFIPDPDTPILIINPTQENLNNKIQLKFKFDENSKGLQNGEFLGVTFPKFFGDLNANFNLKNSLTYIRYNCDLIFGTTKITTNPVTFQNSSENNIAFCQINDPINSPLIPNEIDKEKSLTLTIYFTKFTISSILFARNLSVFSSTSSSLDRMIIDSLKNFSNFGVYAIANIPKALEITNVSPNITKGRIPNKIYVLNTFDITLTIKANSFVSNKDSMIVFKFPTDYVSLPNAISTSAMDENDINTSALRTKASGLQISLLENNSLAIIGIDEDFILGRQFKITLKNIGAIKPTKVAQKIELNIYYLNSYSKFSSSENACFLINFIQLENLLIKSPDHDEVYSGMAWPFDFQFSVNTDINVPSIISIQHSNAKDFPSPSTQFGSKLNFLSATCDFSLNGVMDNFFGVRPKCFPMQYELDYTNSSEVKNYLGSGILFKVNSLEAKIIYKIRVWIMMDECGYNTNPLVMELAEVLQMPYIKHSFNISVQKFVKSDGEKIQKYQNDENKLKFVETNDVVMETKCWQASKNKLYTTIAEVESNGIVTTPGGDYFYSQLDEDATKAKLTLMTKEINNFDLLKTSTASGNYETTDSKGASKIFFNEKKNWNTGNNENNFLFLKYDFNVDNLDNMKSPFNFMPLNLEYTGSAMKNLSGTLEFKFSRNWFKNGAYQPNVNDCYVSWGYRGEGLTNDVLYFSDDSNVNLKTKTNTIFVGKNLNGDETINLNTLILPNSSGDEMLKIQSIFIDKELTTPFNFATTNYNNSATKKNSLSFLLYSNCLELNDAPKPIKSIHNFFEANINWVYSKSETSNKYTVRAIRYLQFFPAIGFFNDIESAENILINSSISNFFKFHYVNIDNEKVNSICLLQLFSPVLDLFKGKITADNDPENNYFFNVNLFNINLLEMDYENIAVNYPVMQVNKKQDLLIESNFLQNSITASKRNKEFSQFSSYDSTKNYNEEINAKLLNYIYLSSSIQILNLGKIPNKNIAGDFNNDLIIPTNCPIRKEVTASVKNTPIISAFLYSKNNFQEINSKINFAYIKTGNLYNNILVETIGKLKVQQKFYTNLRFSQYGDSTENAKLNIFFGTKYNIAPYAISDNQINCSAFSLLINSEISFDETKLKINFPSMTYNDNEIFYLKNKNYLNSNYFFLNRIGFNKILIGVKDIAVNNTKQKADDTSIDKYSNSDFNLEGITRPTVDSFLVNKLFRPFDKISFSCIGSSDDDFLVSNYVDFPQQNNSVQNFVLDFVTFKTDNFFYTKKDTNKIYSEINADVNNEDFYLNENSGNFKLDLYLPIPAPKFGNVKILNAYNFNVDTICGIVNFNTNLVSECISTRGKYQEISCPIYEKNKLDIPLNIGDEFMNPNIYFSICCYNVSIKKDKISLDELIVNLNLQNYDDENTNNNENFKGIDKFLNNNFIKSASQNSVKILDLSKKILNNLANLIPVEINKIEFTYSNHEGALGIMKLQINLPRALIRNSKIIIKSEEFKNLEIPNSIKNCEISDVIMNDNNINNSFAKILPFVDYCKINFTNENLNFIEISFKKSVYKCGLKMPKSFEVKISPVKISKISGGNYLINWILKDSNDKLIEKNKTQKFPEILFDKNLPTSKPFSENNWENLCLITKIFPRFIGEFAYFDFEINTKKFFDLIDNLFINEVSLFFPIKYFQEENFNKLNCVILDSINNLNNLKVNCVHFSNGILSINFSSNIFSKEKNLKFRIYGIQIPEISNENFIIPCTLNSINNIKGADLYNSRYNIITGSAKFSADFFSFRENIGTNKVGNLQIFSIKNFISDINPRSRASYIIQFGFDISSGIKIPLKISDGILLIVKFPSQYNFERYAYSTSFNTISLNPTIEEFVEDAKIIKSNGLVEIKKINYIKNSIHIFLEKSDWTFAANFRNWKINLNYVPSPIEPIFSGSLKLILTNSNNDCYFSNFENLDTSKTTENKSSGDKFVNYNRGVNFYFDQMKIILDLFDENLPLIKNEVALKPGFFKEFVIEGREISSFFKGSLTKIELNDSLFSMELESYLFSSSNPKIKISLGVPCNTLKGIYYINFSLSNSEEFYEMAPIKITVNDIEPSLINLDTVLSIPQGSSQLITYYLQEKSVEDLTISWESHSNNDSSAIIDSIVIKKTQKEKSVFFSIANSEATLPQIFNTVNPNKCFSLNKLSLQFSFSTQHADLSNFKSNPENFIDQFLLIDNSEKDANKLENSLRIKFTPKVFPVYLFCVIICADFNFPSDEEILNPEKSFDFFTLENYFLQNYINSEKEIFFDFKNLMKNQKYKMKCITQTTHSDKEKRLMVSVEISKINKLILIGEEKKLEKNEIKSKEIPYTTCLRFKFGKFFSNNIVKNVLINYCQNLFSNKNGCVICIDNMNSNALGKVPRTFYGCNLNNGERNVQEISMENIFDGPLKNLNINVNDNSQENNNNISHLTICPVQGLFCETTLEKSNYENSINTFLVNLNSNTLIRQNVGLPNLNLLNINKYNDFDMPNLDKMVLTVNDSQISGFYSFTVKNQTPLYCHYAIRSDAFKEIITKDDIVKCADNTRCGTTKINSEPFVVFSTKNSLLSFDNGKYNIWFVCMNDIPNPRSISEPVNKGNFYIDTYVKIDTDVIDGNSSAYLKISWILLIFILNLF